MINCVYVAVTDGPLLTILVIDPEFDDDVNVGVGLNVFVLPNRLVEVNVTDPDRPVELVKDDVANTIDIVVAGNTYDPLDPIHSLALLALFVHKKYSPDAVFAHIAPFTVGLVVVSGLLAVIYVTVLTVI